MRPPSSVLNLTHFNPTMPKASPTEPITYTVQPNEPSYRYSRRKCHSMKLNMRHCS